MTDEAPAFDIRVVRELLLAAFAAEDLRRFCQDRPRFRPILRRFGPKYSRADMVDEVMNYVEAHHLVAELLDQVKAANPDQYARFAPRFTISAEALAEIACPYRGLEVFYAEHAPNYFGREDMVRKLLEKLDETDFVAVVGPSGSGKSSLVMAGMIPALRRGELPGSEAWRVEDFRPGDDALRALALTLVRLLMPDASPVDRLAEARKLADHLDDGTVPVADVMAQVRSEHPDLARLVLIVDQSEEAFTLCRGKAACSRFLERLLEVAAAPWVTIVLTLRADFFGQVLADGTFARRVDGGVVNVLPMTREERRAAVESPALRAGRCFEKGLVGRILDAVESSPGDLPLLEFALTELWGRQRADGLLTHDAYESIGEVRGAIATRADATIKDLDPDKQQAVRAIFMRLVRVARPDEGAEDTRRRIGLDELQPEAQALVKDLADARLLVTGRDPASGEETVEVAHEALIRGWAPLQAWLNRDREFLLWRQRLGTLARIWVESGRGEGALLRDALLEEARVRSAERLDELSALEREYLAESEAAARRAEEARAAARQRALEQARKLAEEQRLRAEESEARRAAEEARARDAEAAAEVQRASSARLRRLLFGLVLVLVIALVSAWLAMRQGQIARARGLISASQLAVRNRDPNLATLLALEAQEYEPGEAERILGNEIPATFNVFVADVSDLPHGPSVTSVAWSPDGRTLASGLADGTIMLWDVARGEAVDTLEGHGVWVMSVAWSPDGRTLASGSVDGTIKLWDVARGEAVHTLEGQGDLVWSVAWHPDGRILASVSWDGTIKLWDVARGEAFYTLEGRGGGVTSVAWHPDGRTLASGSEDGTVKLWDVVRGEAVQTLEGHGPPVRSVAWSPDGHTLASGSDDDTIKLWDVARGEVIQTLEGHGGGVTSVAWSPDERTLASGSVDATIKLWDVERGEAVHTLRGHGGPVRSVAWSPDGRTLASGSSDDTIKLWDVARGEAVQTLEGHRFNVTSVAWSPDGRTLASGSRDDTIKLWNVARGESVRTLMGHGDYVTSVAWSPDERTLASGSRDDTIKLWDVARGEVVLILEGHGGGVTSVAWSPDERTLASGSVDATIKLWDVERGEAVHTLRGHGGPVRSVAWSPDGRTLASASDDGTIKLWDVARGEAVQTLEGHGSSVTSVAWHPDGRTLASGSWDETVKLWDVARGEAVRTLGGHGDGVTSVAWHPDGRTLASGSFDGTIKLWDVVRGEVVQTLEGHGDDVDSLAWSPDGRTLASGSADRTIKLWPEFFTRHPCTWVYANLTPAQWTQFMGWSIYRPTCPARPSEPAPSIADAINEDPAYLLITWLGRVVFVAGGLVCLTLLGLLFWGSYHMLHSRRRAIVAGTIMVLLLALLFFVNEAYGIDLPIFILVLTAALAGCAVTLLLWGGYRLGCWSLRKIRARSEVTTSR